MKSRYFGELGRVFNFFDSERYDMKKRASVNVSAGKTDWSVENTLTDTGLESNLEVSHALPKETLSVSTSTGDNPRFEVNTSRAKACDVSFAVKEPTFDITLRKQKEKWSGALTHSYDFANGNSQIEAEFVYEQRPKFAFGLRGRASREASDGSLASEDYGFLAEYAHNDKILVSFASENAFSQFKVGTSWQLKPKVEAYLQLCLTPPAKDGSDNTDIDYGVGFRWACSDKSDFVALHRKDNSGTVQYSSEINNFRGTVAYNYRLDNLAATTGGSSLEYAVAFNF